MRFAFLLLLIPFLSSAQTVKGYIVDQENHPVIGAQVFEAGTRNGTTSNIDGSYYLELTKEEANLVVSFVGFETDTVTSSSLTKDAFGLSTITLTPEAPAFDIKSLLSDYMNWFGAVWVIVCVWLVARTFRGKAAA